MIDYDKLIDDFNNLNTKDLLYIGACNYRVLSPIYKLGNRFFIYDIMDSEVVPKGQYFEGILLRYGYEDLPESFCKNPELIRLSILKLEQERLNYLNEIR